MREGDSMRFGEPLPHCACWEGIYLDDRVVTGRVPRSMLFSYRGKEIKRTVISTCSFSCVVAIKEQSMISTATKS